MFFDMCHCLTIQPAGTAAGCIIGTDVCGTDGDFDHVLHRSASIYFLLINYHLTIITLLAFVMLNEEFM